QSLNLSRAFTPGTLTPRWARRYRPRSQYAGVFAMLPASTFAEITANVAALQLEPNIAAQILAAVFAPLLRTADPVPVPAIREKRVGRRPRPRPARSPAAQISSRRPQRSARSGARRAQVARAQGLHATRSHISSSSNCPHRPVARHQLDRKQVCS